MKIKFIYFYLCIIFNLCLYSQECKQMTVLNDDVSGSTTILSEVMNLGKFSFTVMSGTRKGVYPKILFRVNNECIDVYSKIYILFESGERIESGNYVFKYNCNGDTGFIINNSKNEKLLRSKIIQSIRVHTYDSYYQADLTKEQSDKINSTLNCAFDRKSWEHLIKYK